MIRALVSAARLIAASLGVASILVSALPATAQDLMSAAEFEQYTRGKTLFLDRDDGRAYATETYLENRRVRWAPLDGDCVEGRWFEQSGLICFLYDNSPSELCWSVRMTESGITARLENEADQTVLSEIPATGPAPACLGPKLGV